MQWTCSTCSIPRTISASLPLHAQEPEGNPSSNAVAAFRLRDNQAAISTTFALLIATDNGVVLFLCIVGIFCFETVVASTRAGVSLCRVGTSGPLSFCTKGIRVQGCLRCFPTALIALTGCAVTKLLSAQEALSSLL